MIKNLLLDMGGVILDVDYNKIFSSFASYGADNVKEFYTQSYQLPLIDDFEKGNISAVEFRKQVNQLIGKNLSDTEIDNIWNSMILEVKKDVIALIGELKLKYEKILLFSNTNEIHTQYVKKAFNDAIGFDVFTLLFDKSYFSNEIHFRKPDKESFLYVMNDAGIEPQQTLFIDDTQKNTEGAKLCGLNTYWLTCEETLLDLYNRKLI